MFYVQGREAALTIGDKIWNFHVMTREWVKRLLFLRHRKPSSVIFPFLTRSWWSQHTFIHFQPRKLLNLIRGSKLRLNYPSPSSCTLSPGCENFASFFMDIQGNVYFIWFSVWIIILFPSRGWTGICIEKVEVNSHFSAAACCMKSSSWILSFLFRIRMSV